MSSIMQVNNRLIIIDNPYQENLLFIQRNLIDDHHTHRSQLFNTRQ